MSDTMRIVNYGASWNTASNQGKIEISLESGEKKTWTGPDVTEFNAIMQLLQGGATPFWMPDGSIAVRAEFPGP